MDAVLQSIFRRHFKESGTLQRAMALAAVDSDIDDYIGKSAIDDNEDSFD
ncbi:hypothetical protein IWW34DRAFT_857494 [Fusarium oxysporum f. sp. albedinis]|nr:hypothetical protein IWW34DRAFT_857494 [Fusarium oxysporum f. sp. albedinis]